MREMKDSGIDWIGMIPKNWDTKRLKNVLIERNEKNNPIKSENLLSLSIERGVFPYSEKTGGGNKAKENFEDYKLAYENDIVLNSMNVVVGAVGLSKYFGCISPAYYALYCRSDNYNINYYNNLFQSSAFQKSLWGLGNGILVKESDNGKLNTIRMKIPMDKLNNVILPIPPKDEQKKIAAFLDKKINEIDNVIEKTKETIEDYKAYKVSIIKEIFDKFIDERTITKKIGQMSYLVTKQTGFDYSSTIKPSLLDNANENTIPYLQTRHFKDNYFDYNTEFHIPIEVAEKFPKIMLTQKCLLFSIVGASIGNVAVYPGNKRAFLGGAICKVNLNDENMYDYIKSYMISEYGQRQIFNKINSNAQGTITVQNVRDFVIPIPNKEIQKEIVREVKEKSEMINNLIVNKEKIVEELENYKRSLIYEYVTGKKEVV